MHVVYIKAYLYFAFSRYFAMRFRSTERPTSSSDIPRAIDDETACIVTFGLLFGVQMCFAHPSIPGGDSGKFYVLVIQSLYEIEILNARKL